MITKNLDVTIHKAKSEEGVFEVIASSGKTDRMGDIIDPKGWYLTNYKKNPVLLWAHNTGGGFGSVAVPPVGKATKVWIENGKELRIKGKWADTPFAQELKTLVEGGFLNAVSVGFMPLVEDKKGAIEIDEKMYRRVNDEEIKKGIYDNDYGEKFTKQELLEVSWVSVPALPQALVTARKMNLGLMTKALEEKEDTKEKDETPNIETAIEDITTKDGRVISAKNRTLINNCLKQMGTAIDALRELLEATEPTETNSVETNPCTDITPDVSKGRSDDKAKGRVNPELRLMRLADKAVEDALAKLKENKVNRKVEIRYLRIASKAFDAANINVKGKIKND